MADVKATQSKRKDAKAKKVEEKQRTTRLKAAREAKANSWLGWATAKLEELKDQEHERQHVQTDQPSDENASKTFRESLMASLKPWEALEGSGKVGYAYFFGLLFVCWFFITNFIFTRTGFEDMLGIERQAKEAKAVSAHEFYGA